MAQRQKNHKLRRCCAFTMMIGGERLQLGHAPCVVQTKVSARHSAAGVAVAGGPHAWAGEASRVHQSPCRVAGLAAAAADAEEGVQVPRRRDTAGVAVAVAVASAVARAASVALPRLAGSTR